MDLKADKHEQYMKRALELARMGLGHVSPNPMVGAVIVRNGDKGGRMNDRYNVQNIDMVPVWGDNAIPCYLRTPASLSWEIWIHENIDNRSTLWAMN